MTGDSLTIWLSANPQWQRVLSTLLRETSAYLVGGTVRDILLDRPSCDLDLAVEGGAMALARRVADALGSAYVPLDAERDVARIVLADGDERRYVDIAALRAEGIEADLRARDLTINAMAWTLTASGPGRLLDPLHGRHDLRTGLLRATSAQAFSDDPLRILRVARLRGALGFRVERQTSGLMREAAPLLSRVSSERLRDELLRMVALPAAAEALVYLLGFDVAPFLGLSDGSEARSALASLDVWESWFGPLFREASLEGLPANLCHPVTPHAQALASYWREELADERPRWWMSKLAAWLAAMREGCARAGEFGRGLHLSTREVRHLSGAVCAAQEVWPHLAELPSRPLAIYRYYRQVDEAGVDGALITLVRPGMTAEIASRTEGVAQRLCAWFERHDEWVDPPALLSGREVMAELGLSPGPVVGERLEQLREAQVQGLVETPQDAVAYLRRLAQG